MTEAQVLAYVQAAAAALDLQLDPARMQRVAAHLAQTAQMAALLDAYPLTPEDEPAQVYDPTATSAAATATVSTAPTPSGGAQERRS